MQKNVYKIKNKIIIIESIEQGTIGYLININPIYISFVIKNKIRKSFRMAPPLFHSI